MQPVTEVSEYGECGTGAYCLGGCDPVNSYLLESCMPTPVSLIHSPQACGETVVPPHEEDQGSFESFKCRDPDLRIALTFSGSVNTGLPSRLASLSRIQKSLPLYSWCSRELSNITDL